MSKYVLPIGVDAENLVNPLNEAISTMEKAENAAVGTGKSINDALNTGAKAAEKLDEKLKPIGRDLESVIALGKKAGQELAQAFSERNINPSGLDKAVSSFQKKLEGVSGKIDIKLDDASLKIYEKQLQSAKNEVEQLSIALRIAKDVMSKMDVNSAEYKELAETVAFTEAAIDEFNKTVVETEKTQISAKQQLKAMTNELNNMKLAGLEGTEAYKKLHAEAAELKDTIADTNASLKAAGSDTKTFDGLISGAQGLAGAFAVAQGAAGLFGDENKDLEKALLKVNAAMAILQGLQAVAETLNKDSAFSVVFLSNARKADVVATEGQIAATAAQAVAMNGASLAAKALRLSLSAIGIGLIISLVAYLIANWDSLKKSMEKLLPVGVSVAGTFDKLKSVFVGVGTALVEYIIAPFKIAIALITEGLDGAVEQAKKSYNVVDNYNKGYRQQEINNAKNHARDLKRERLEQWDNAIKIAEAEGKDTYATRSKWYKNKIALAKQEGEDTKDLLQEAAEFEARHRGDMAKKAADAAKNAADEAKKQREKEQREAEEAAKKALEFKKAQDALLIKYTDEINKANISKIQDEYEREREAIRTEAANKIRDLQKDGAKRADVLEKQAELIKSINEDANNRLLELEKKHNEEKTKLRLEGEKMIVELQKAGAARELALAEAEHNEKLNDIATKFKNETDLKIRLTEAENAAYEDRKKKITLDARQKEISENQSFEESMLEIMTGFAGESVAVEEQKQIALSQIRLKYAKENLNNLVANGGTDAEVAAAVLAVQKAQKAADDAVKNGKKFSWTKLLGMDKLKPEEQQAVVDASKQMLSSLSQITDGLIENYQRQIDKKQEAIDQYNNEISDLEERLEEEKALRENGFANNVEVIEKEIEAKKAQRDEEIRQQKEMQEKQRQLQKMQMVADTAVQLVNMITASTEIFKSLAGIPFIGVPLAIATIATMFGAFAIAKANAFNSVNSQKMRGGGMIGGDKSHEMGGKKYYSADGDGYELEDGEHVMPKDKTSKYFKLLEAMRTDNFNGINPLDFGVIELFRNLGFDPNEINSANYDSNELRELAGVTVNVSSDSDEIRSMSKNIGFLARSKRDEAEHWEDAEFYYTKRGTRITKIRKK